MNRISDNIEDFILSTLGENAHINLSRNDLAHYFNCAPSQINYVLTTRFNINRGFVIESQRGGGGYIKVVKLQSSGSDYLMRVLDDVIKDEISFKDATFVLEDLVSKGFISSEQSRILLYAVQDKALVNPIKMENRLRANILRNALVNLYRRGEGSS